MRLIINTKLFSSLKFKALTPSQQIALLEIAEYVLANNTHQVEGNLRMLAALTGLPKDEVKEMSGEKTGFFEVKNEEVTWLSPFVSYFKNNKENVQKCLAKKKSAPQEVAVAPVKVEEPKPKKADNTDWNGIMEAYNETFKDFKYVTLIQGMDDKRKTAVKKVYEYAKKQINPKTKEKNDFADIHEFCEQYFALCSELKGVQKSWKNQNGENYFMFHFDRFFFNMEKYKNITEAGMYN